MPGKDRRPPPIPQESQFLSNKYCTLPETNTHRIHGTIVYLPIHEWLIFMVNVGKYTIPMDPMGHNHLQIDTFEHDFPFKDAHLFRFSKLRWFCGRNPYHQYFEVSRIHRMKIP